MNNLVGIKAENIAGELNILADDILYTYSSSYSKTFLWQFISEILSDEIIEQVLSESRTTVSYLLKAVGVTRSRTMSA